MLLGLVSAPARADDPSPEADAALPPPVEASDADERGTELLDVPGPPSTPGLSHPGTLFDFEYTVASLRPTDVLSYQPIEGARAYAYATRLSIESALEPRAWYLGIAAGFAAASVPAGTTPGSGGSAVVPANPELWARTLWSNSLGLSAGATVGAIVPVPRTFSSVELEAMRALRVVHPWDYPTYQNLVLTLRPSFEVRDVLRPFVLQARQGIDVSFVVRDLVGSEHRVELGGSGSQFASVEVERLVSIGVELAEAYALTADVSSPECPAPCDAHRLGITVSPVVRLRAPLVSPSLSVLIPLATPLRGDAASYFAARIDLEFQAPWALSDLW